jgi:hypothetical protein
MTGEGLQVLHDSCEVELVARAGGIRETSTEAIEAAERRGGQLRPSLDLIQRLAGQSVYEMISVAE